MILLNGSSSPIHFGMGKEECMLNCSALLYFSSIVTRLLTHALPDMPGMAAS